MNSSKVVSNYTKALFALAKQRDIEESVLNELNILSKFLDSDVEAKSILSSPVELLEKKDQIVHIIVESLELSNLISKFLLLLVRYKRVALLTDITKNYRESWYKDKNVKIVEVTSSAKLSSNDVKWITEHLKDLLKQDVELYFKEDKSIIKGLVIEYDSMMIDYSIQGMLNTFTNQMKIK